MSTNKNRPFGTITRSTALFLIVICMMLSGGFSQAAEVSSEDQASHHQAVDLARAGQYPQALGLLQELVRRHPDVYVYKADQALVTLWSGDCREAVNLFERIRGHPEHKPYLIVPVSHCLQKLNRHAESMALLREELRKHPDTQELKQALAAAQDWEHERRSPDLNKAGTLAELGATSLALESLNAGDDKNARQNEETSNG